MSNELLKDKRIKLALNTIKFHIDNLEKTKLDFLDKFGEDANHAMEWCAENVILDEYTTRLLKQAEYTLRVTCETADTVEILRETMEQFRKHWAERTQHNVPHHSSSSAMANLRANVEFQAEMHFWFGRLGGKGLFDQCMTSLYVGKK